MPGYMTLIAVCVGCEATIIGAHPDYCPSIRVEGVRHPICRDCFDRWNRIHRTDKGLEPEPLHPLAYAAQEVA